MDAKVIKDVEDMPVYQLFYRLSLTIERESRNFRSDFRWLRNQVLRSSESVCANMSEGFYAQYSTEYLQCLYRSRREANDTRVHVAYSKDVEQLSARVADQVLSGYGDGLRQLAGIISSIERKMSLRGKAKPSASTAKV